MMGGYKQNNQEVETRGSVREDWNIKSPKTYRSQFQHFKPTHQQTKRHYRHCHYSAAPVNNFHPKKHYKHLQVLIYN